MQDREMGMENTQRERERGKRERWDKERGTSRRFITELKYNFIKT